MKRFLPDEKNLEPNLFCVLPCLAMYYMYLNESFILKTILETTATYSRHEFKQIMMKI